MNELSERAKPYFDKVQKLAPIIREHADRAEREAQMPREVADAFHEAGMFRMLLPRKMGGGELTIPDSLRLIEEVVAHRRLGGMEPRDLRRRSDIRALPFARGIRENLRRSARSHRRFAESDDQPGDSRSKADGASAARPPMRAARRMRAT